MMAPGLVKREPEGLLPPTQASPPSFSSCQQCSNCGTLKTPLWRRTPEGKLLCNACGLYYRANNSHRPVHLKKAPTTVLVVTANALSSGLCSGDGNCNGMGGKDVCLGCPAFNNRVLIAGEANTELQPPAVASPQLPHLLPSLAAANGIVAIACANCNTTVTPLWRRSAEGDTICNACGLYFKLHGLVRPVKMKKSTIKRRKRHYLPESSPPQGFAQVASQEPAPKITPKTERSSADPPSRHPTPVNFTGMSFPSPLAMMSSALPPLIQQVTLPPLTVDMAELPLPHIALPLLQHARPELTPSPGMLAMDSLAAAAALLDLSREHKTRGRSDAQMKIKNLLQ